MMKFEEVLRERDELRKQLCLVQENMDKIFDL